MSNKLRRILYIEGEPKYEKLVTSLNPFEIFKKIYPNYNDLFIYESLVGPKELIKSSIIGFEPRYKIKCNSNQLLIFEKEKEIERISITDPFETLQENFPSVKNIEYRYVGGLVGYVSYESIKFWENINVKKDKNFPLMEFGLYTDGIIYDHDKNELEYFYYKSSRLNIIKRIIKGSDKRKYTNNMLVFRNLSRNIEKKEFEKKVKKIKHYLSKGDIFQAVLSKKIKFVYSGDPLYLYEELRKINPSPYMFFFKINPRILIGSSPEMLLRITGNKVETYPIAGSRAVSPDKKITEYLRQEMLKDEKEIAEHTMLVDLARNDLGKVCSFGTVKTTDLMSVKQFSHIQHLVSHVVGDLDNQYTIFDAFRALFPAGTMSGAPKIRAMEIINELEPESRGPYAGAIGYFSFNRSCDFSITIRSIFLDKNKGYNQSGAGIVIDSIPKNEYKETEDKSNAILSSLEIFKKTKKEK